MGAGKADGLGRCGLVGLNQFKSVLTCTIDNNNTDNKQERKNQISLIN